MKHVGLGAAPGFGTAHDARLNWQIGPQMYVYPVGDFANGLQLGAESLLSGSSGHPNYYPESRRTELKMGLAASVGYKYQTARGFTVHFQLGLRHTLLRTPVSDATASAYAFINTTSLLYRFNLEYTF